jgi:hypothetical protein
MRPAEDLITARVRAALGDKYEAAADYRVIRPAMVGLPKYRNDEVVGEFVEDGRDGGKLVIVRRAAPRAAGTPPAPGRVAAAAERVRSVIASAAKPPAARKL